MNLLEHYIEKVISVVDVTKEWEKCMQEEDPNFIETDPMLKIKVLVNCMGVEECNILWYHKSEWDKIDPRTRILYGIGKKFIIKGA